MMRSFLAVLLIALSLVAPGAVHGQGAWPVSLEASLGRGSGSTSGEYRSNDAGLVGDLLAAVDIVPIPAGRLVYAMSIGVQGTGAVTSNCIPASGGGCVPGFPEFTLIGALGGWETSNRVLRLLAGPTYVATDGAFGWQARASVFLPPLSHVSLGLLLRGAIIPDYDGATFRLIAGGITLRLR